MSQGFNITVWASTAADLTADSIADELVANGALTALESATYLPSALSAAQALCASLTSGPFNVNLVGVDNMQIAGNASVISVTVTSNATIASELVAVAAPESPAVAESTDTVGPADEPAPAVEVTPAPDIAPAADLPAAA